MTRDATDLLSELNQKLAAENQALKVRLQSGGGTPHGGNELLAYRMDQFEKRSEAADARMGRVEDKLTAIQISIATLATRDAVRNWNLAVLGIVVAAVVAVGAMILQSSGNQLSAFRAGLAAVQAASASAAPSR